MTYPLSIFWRQAEGRAMNDRANTSHRLPAIPLYEDGEVSRT